MISEEARRATAADRELAADLARLRERIDGFDATDRTIVPPELAEQLKRYGADVRAICRPLTSNSRRRWTTGLSARRANVGRPAATVLTVPTVQRATRGRPAATAFPSSATAINRDGELMLTLSDGTVLTPGTRRRP